MYRILLFIFFIPFFGEAQKSHYSQIHELGQVANPAMLGYNMDKARVVGVHRSQWANIGNAYKSTFLSFERVLKQLNVGAYYQNNNAGKSSLTENNFIATVGYKASLFDNLSVRFGVQLGMTQYAINPNEFTFENQYSLETGYNPLAVSGENIIASKVSHAFLGFGGAVNYEVNNQLSILGGFSVLDILNKKQSFLNIFSTVDSYSRFNIHFGSNVILNDFNRLNFKFFRAFKKDAQETTVLVYNQFGTALKSGFRLGGGLRFNDAAILYVGYQTKGVELGVSYDVNISKLKNTSAIELGLTFNFGKAKRVKLPEKNNDELQVQAVENNIDNDFDKDGIINENDQCPYEFGLKKYRGCPFKDLDRDGITDDVDLCPSLFGAGNPSGCPDSDRDGIADHIDKCPNNPGPIIYEGCPEVRVVVEYKEKEIKSQKPARIVDSLMVYFDKDSYKLKNEYHNDLLKFISKVKQFENYQIILSGHTDSDGSDFYNLNLGDKRSKSVFIFLIINGLEGEKIIPITYGENKPITNDSSERAMAKNRRVEVKIISR